MKRLFPFHGFLVGIALVSAAAIVTYANVGGRLAGQTGGGGLLAHWTFDQGTINGNTVQDVSGNGFNLTNNGGTPQNGCMLFNGTSNFLTTSNVAGLPSGNSPRSVVFWLNRDAGNGLGMPFSLGTTTIYGVNSGEPQRFIVGPGSDTATNTAIFSDAVNDGNGANNIFISGNGVPSTNAWHHIAFNYNGAQGWQYYLDGSLVSTGTFGIPINTVTNGLDIGALRNYRHGTEPDGSQHPDWFLAGKMDDVRIYDHALSAQEIAQLAQLQPTCAGGQQSGGNSCQAYEYTMTVASTAQVNASGITGTATSCANAAPAGTTLVDAKCIYSNQSGCTAMYCLWKKPSSQTFAYFLQHGGGNLGDSVDCSAQLTQGQQLVARGCALKDANTGNCISDLCLGREAGAEDLRLTQAASGGCDQNDPTGGGATADKECMLSSGSSCLTSICLWKTPFCDGNLDFCGAICGDRIIMEPEECDKGPQNSDTEPDACRSSCLKAHCGDGVIDTGEACDDGNTVNGDGCSSICQVQSSSSSSSSTSSSSSKSSSVPSSAASSTSSATSSAASSVAPKCGDGRRNQASEECDDANTKDGDGCDHLCKEEIGWKCVVPGSSSSSTSSSTSSGGSSTAGGGTICCRGFGGGQTDVCIAYGEAQPSCAGGQTTYANTQACQAACGSGTGGSSSSDPFACNVGACSAQMNGSSCLLHPISTACTEGYRAVGGQACGTTGCSGTCYTCEPEEASSSSSSSTSQTQQQSCTDSDGGYDISKKGSLNTGETDYCESSTQLHEYNCAPRDNDVSIRCPAGLGAGCVDGRCVNPGPAEMLYMSDSNIQSMRYVGDIKYLNGGLRAMDNTYTLMNACVGSTTLDRAVAKGSQSNGYIARVREQCPNNFVCKYSGSFDCWPQ